MLGPLLTDAVAMFHTRPLSLIVLASGPDAVASRERGRAKVGYRDVTPATLDADFRAHTPRLGFWIDTSEMTVDETVQHILDHRAEAIVDIT